MSGPLDFILRLGLPDPKPKRRRAPRPGKPHIQLPAGQGIESVRQNPEQPRPKSHWSEHVPSTKQVRTWTLTLGGVVCLVIAIIPPLEPQYFTAAGLLLGLEAVARV
jgi:hypothetical protein